MMDLRSGTLVSPVGEQPGATATVAKALLAARPELGRVVLFPSARTARFAEPLAGYLRGLGLEVDVRPGAEHDARAVADRVRQGCRLGPTWFNCASGLSYFVGKVAGELRDEPAVEALYASFTDLHAVGDRWRVPLENLGVGELLALHGLSFRAEAADGPVHRGFVLLDDRGEKQLDATYAYELRGRLFCLVDPIDDLDAARGLLYRRKHRTPLGEFQPQLTACTSRWEVATRLRLAGVDVILRTGTGEEAQRRVEGWLRQRPPEPGSTPPERGREYGGGPPAPRPGAGGDGPPLLVCLGSEPDSTLQALWAHRPRVAWILYDRTTLYVRALAERLAETADRLPAGEVRFVPVTHAAKDMGNEELRPLVAAEGPVCANVTPGTKAQAWALGRLDEAWAMSCSLDTRRPPRVVRLADDHEVPGTAWAAPDLLVQVGVRGGPLADPGRDGAFLSGRAEFLSAVAALVAELARGEARGLFALWPNYRWDHAECARGGLRWRRQDDPARPDETALWVEVTRRDGKALAGAFCLPLDENKKTGKKEPRAGVWLEEVVGHAVLAAGGSDVHVGMTWGWPEKPKKKRTELDVVCRWGLRNLVGISVKASALKPAERARCCREITAVAYECLGRLALPVLLSALPAADLAPERVLANLDATGVLHLGLGHLDAPATIGHLVGAAFERLQKAAPPTTSPPTVGDPRPETRDPRPGQAPPSPQTTGIAPCPAGGSPGGPLDPG